MLDDFFLLSMEFYSVAMPYGNTLDGINKLRWVTPLIWF